MQIVSENLIGRQFGHFGIILRSVLDARAPVAACTVARGRITTL